MQCLVDGMLWRELLLLLLLLLLLGGYGEQQRQQRAKCRGDPRQAPKRMRLMMKTAQVNASSNDNLRMTGLLRPCSIELTRINQPSRGKFNGV